MKLSELILEANKKTQLYSKNIKRIFKGKPMYVVVADRKSYSSPYYITTTESMKPVQQDIVNRLKKPIINDAISLDPLIEKFKKAKEQGLQPVLIYLKPTMSSNIKKAMNESETTDVDPQMLDVDVGEIATIKKTRMMKKAELTRIRKVAKVVILKR